MMIPGWKSRYLAILKEFSYSKKADEESAILLDSILKQPTHINEIIELIKGRTVFVIGSGPSLSEAIPQLKRYEEITKIVADSAVKPLIENGIIPNMIVTDLDGDRESLNKMAKTECIFVVHAHGDNFERLGMVKKINRCIGTTQSSPIGKICNFGGFTDGDRSVFLADHFGAKKIVLFGMDFGSRIGKFSRTKKHERKVKLKKLKTGESLLEWLSCITNSELFTTSRKIGRFNKISFQDLDNIVT